MKRFAIIMAAEQYADPSYSPTPFCHADATLLRDTLVNYCDYAEQDVLLELLDQASAASPATILERLDEIGKRSRTGDTILFFYAGHGGLFNGETYLILPNTQSSNKTQTALPFRDVSNALRLRGRTNVRVFDTCHSGADVRSVLDSATTDTELDEGGLLRAVTLSTEDGWITFAACRAEEYSYSDSTKKHGVFTWAMAEAISELSPGEDVYPELVKVALCKKVRDWAEASGLTQTPSFNSAISGNVTIARRQHSARVEESANETKSAAELTQKVQILAGRLKPGSAEHKQRLRSLAERAKATLDSELNAMESFGCEKKLTGPESAYNIPDDLRPSFVRIVSRQPWKTVHEVKEDRITSEVAPTVFDKMMGRYDNTVTTTKEYRIRQPSGWPDSLLTLKIASDGIIPEAAMFIYLLPLQVRAALVALVALKGTLNVADSAWAVKTVAHTVVDLEPEHEAPAVDFLVERCKHFSEVLRDALAERVRLLEEELSL